MWTWDLGAVTTTPLDMDMATQFIAGAGGRAAVVGPVGRRSSRFRPITCDLRRRAADATGYQTSNPPFGEHQVAADGTVLTPPGGCGQCPSSARVRRDDRCAAAEKPV